MKINLLEYLNLYPHNTDTNDRFYKLFEIAYTLDTKGDSPEEFAQNCLDNYGGTLAGALVDYIYNNL